MATYARGCLTRQSLVARHSLFLSGSDFHVAPVNFRPFLLDPQACTLLLSKGSQLFYRKFDQFSAFDAV